MNGKWNVGAVLLDMDGTLLDDDVPTNDGIARALELLVPAGCAIMRRAAPRESRPARATRALRATRSRQDAGPLTVISTRRSRR